MPSKTAKRRKSPTESATTFPEGTIKQGNDKKMWVVKGRRWMPYQFTELFGYKPLTVDYLEKHIGKPIVIYERDYESMWPTRATKMNVATFTASGDAGVLGRKLTVNWLKTRTPSIKDHTVFTVDGPLQYKGSDTVLVGLQVDSVNKTFVSSNILNTETFIKV